MRQAASEIAAAVIRNNDGNVLQILTAIDAEIETLKTRNAAFAQTLLPVPGGQSFDSLFPLESAGNFARKVLWSVVREPLMDIAVQNIQAGLRSDFLSSEAFRFEDAQALLAALDTIYPGAREMILDRVALDQDSIRAAVENFCGCTQERADQIETMILSHFAHARQEAEIVLNTPNAVLAHALTQEVTEEGQRAVLVEGISHATPLAGLIHSAEQQLAWIESRIAELSGRAVTIEQADRLKIELSLLRKRKEAIELAIAQPRYDYLVQVQKGKDAIQNQQNGAGPKLEQIYLARKQLLALVTGTVPSSSLRAALALPVAAALPQPIIFIPVHAQAPAPNPIRAISALAISLGSRLLNSVLSLCRRGNREEA